MKPRLTVVITVLLLSFHNFAAAQDGAPNTAAVFRDLRASVAAVKNQVTPASTDREELVATIERNLNIINEKWRQSRDKSVPPDYLTTLKFDSQLLLRAAARGTSSEESLSLLGEVNDDLAIKVAHARATQNAEESLPSKVNVTVKTRRNGQAVDGYLVRCNPRRYANQSTPMFVFNNPTSPASRPLPPGNYKMWLESDGGAQITSRTVTIGGNGEAAQEIVFDVP